MASAETEHYILGENTFTLTKTKLDLNLLTSFSCHQGVILSQIIYEPNMFCCALNYADRKITQKTDFLKKGFLFILLIQYPH